DMYEAKNLEAFFGTSIQPMKLKASFEDIVDAIDGAGKTGGHNQGEIISPADEIIVTPGDGEGNEGGIVPVPGMDVDVLLGMLDTLKIKVALDTENGLKAKITVDKESYDAILALAEKDAEADDMGDVLEGIAELKNMLEINNLRIDIYLAFDANGLFSAFAVDCDIDAKLKTANIPDMPIMISGDFNVKINGGTSVKIYNGDITLPNGIATDSSYIDLFEVIG
ncbi:MAG: hypothetical protein K2K28_03300, partial [Clostridia bacterium]|nr:hypothetical protein [Clostridia bacterium]